MIFNPRSTYRLQFNRNFTLRQAQKILPYLHRLGIKTIYASPIFKATKGSLHGYDVTSPLVINPEIGSREEFEAVISDLHRLKMGWIQDIVPNHMAYSAENPWICDVLEKGPYSSYYHYFDIYSNHPGDELRNKIFLPFFGDTVSILIDKRQISVAPGPTGLKLKYYVNEYPVSIPAYSFILGIQEAGSIPLKISGLLEDIKLTANRQTAAVQFSAVYNSDRNSREYIKSCLSALNHDTGKMQSLLKYLFYLPVYWKRTSKSINYRRFFTINSLICLNMQHEEVFDTCHKLISEWTENGIIDGLRIDHIDGLYDPSEYLDKLKKLCGEKTYYCVEKILAENEHLPDGWPVQGTTGYDFLAAVNNLLTNRKSFRPILDHYHSFTKNKISYKKKILETKKNILYNHLKGELDRLGSEYLELAKQITTGDPNSAETYSQSLEQAGRAIGAFLVHFPVYKIYDAPSGFTIPEKKLVQKTFKEAGQDRANADILPALSSLQDIILLKGIADTSHIRQIDHFFRLCMQYTGALMAKGLEDTAFYSYVPFLAHCEVGDSPGYYGISTDRFHAIMVYRQEHYPLAMNCTATHDTKRGEDARARLNVLGDIPDKWITGTKKWQKINALLKQKKDNKEIPDPREEYFIYQSLCGHLPMNGSFDRTFQERFEDYITKALREAKENTSWNNPDEDYENRILEFIRKMLSSTHHFKADFLSFMREVIPYGITNSITQTILRYLAPGLPDTYQGTELYDLSFVDPDNRHPVRYENQSKQLDELLDKHHADAAGLLHKLWSEAADGKIKLLISHVCLQMRKENENLFSKGSYVPLKVQGKYRKHIIAFYRRYHDEHLLVILPLSTAALTKNKNWIHTCVQLPDFAPPAWENRLSKEILKASGSIEAGEVFKPVPFGILKGIPARPERQAGILMHITSLPGRYGIGDFGKDAFRFVDFLNRTGQKYWQILPLNITDRHTQYSPYSSYSAFAMNTLFVDPGNLSELGLVKLSELKKYESNASGRVDYHRAEKSKNDILDMAYRSFHKKHSSDLGEAYQTFLQKEKYWLDDFALFSVLKQSLNNKPWNEWPLPYRDREKVALRKFTEDMDKDIDKCKFIQFLLNRQWHQLKIHANEKNIKIFGDIPVYMNYDSVDVWTSSGLFRLNTDKSMKYVAGVPPDYFNSNGQLWGMPVYDWGTMEKDGFKWWLARLRKNLEWFDLVRLDHFRGFSAYWEVPAGSLTAVNGKWVKGPGNRFFDTVQREFPQMPFVAEDLGQIDQAVYDLRDTYHLPGMKVLQFGFGPNMPFLQHVPNNHTYRSIVYTSTHDNNTLKGWYRKESDKGARRRFRQYTGIRLKRKDCHLKFIRLAYSSVAKTAIVPMQDWLGLNERHRMNLPSTTEGNWLWRLRKKQLTDRIERRIKEMVILFGRY